MRCGGKPNLPGGESVYLFLEFTIYLSEVGSFNSPVVRSSGQDYGGARCPAYGLGAFRNQSKTQKLNDPISEGGACVDVLVIIA